MTVSPVWDDDIVPTSEHSDEPRLSYIVARLERAMRRAIRVWGFMEISRIGDQVVDDSGGRDDVIRRDNPYGHDMIG